MYVEPSPARAGHAVDQNALGASRLTTPQAAQIVTVVSRHRLVLLAIVVAGIGIRLTYTFTTGDQRGLSSRQGQIAHNLVSNGRWFERDERAEAYVEELSVRRDRLIDPASVDYADLHGTAHWLPEANQPIGVSAVMAGLWAVTGDQRYVQLEILQGFLDGLIALLVYRIAMQLFKRRRPALIAAALYAIYPPIAWQTADTYNDIWAVDFTIVITAIYLQMLTSAKAWRWLVLCGICVGVSAYFRPQVLFIPLAFAIATAAATGWREALRRAALATIVASLLLVPWVIRNYDDFHAFVPTRTAFWQTMLGGLTEIPGRFGKGFTNESIEATVDRRRPDLVPESPAWDSAIKPYVVRAIEQHPASYAEILLRRVAISTVLTFDPAWLHRGPKYAFGYKGGVLAFLVNQPFAALERTLQPVVFLLAMLGLWLTWKPWKRQHAVLLALVLSVLLPYIAVHVEARYLLPAAFAYMIWIGLGADHLIEHGLHRARSGGGALHEAEIAGEAR